MSSGSVFIALLTQFNPAGVPAPAPMSPEPRAAIVQPANRLPRPSEREMGKADDPKAKSNGKPPKGGRSSNKPTDHGVHPKRYC